MTDAISTARAALQLLLEGRDLEEQVASALMRALTDAQLPAAVIAAVLIALRLKGETAPEIRGFARAMRELAIDPGIATQPPTVDCVGTGGDGSGSVNISTGAALLGAACGLRVVKHGNRAVSSKSGSADVLEELGLSLPMDNATAVRCLEETGFTFLFAPSYHPAMKTVAPVRAAMGVRTIFNLLGPLTNPARTPYALIGAYSPQVARLMAETLAGMEVERMFVIHGEPGWDEATPAGSFLLFDVRHGDVQQQRRDPADFGLARCSAADLAGGTPAENAASLRAVFSGRTGPHYDALVLNTALLLEVSGAVEDFGESLEQVRQAIASGRATALLERVEGFQ